MIHVCYAIYDARGTYSKFVGASVCSLFENTKEPVTIHILHDETLTELNRQRFETIAATYDQTIEFYDVELDEKISEFMKNHTQHSPATLYRLGMSKLLPNSIDKVIYLDADTIINLDIKSLWNEIGADDLFGAVVDAGIATEGWDSYKQIPSITKGFVKREDCFNAGVWVVNLDKFRAENNFFSEAMKLFGERTSDFVDNDQGLLNYFYSKRYKKLPGKYNVQLVMERRKGLRHVGEGIYHYIVRSLNARLNDEFDRLFWHYFVKTPWFDEKFFLDAIDQFRAAAATQQMVLMKALYTCERLIFWAPAALEARIFDILSRLQIGQHRGGEIKFIANGEETLEPAGGYGDIYERTNADILALKAMFDAEPKNGRVLLPITNYYHVLRRMFKQSGYVEGTDFVDARKLLPELRGTYMLDDFDVISKL